MDGSNQQTVLTSKSTKFGDITIDNINERLVVYCFLSIHYTRFTCQLSMSAVHYYGMGNE